MDVMLVACNRFPDRFFAKILDAAASCDEMALVVDQVGSEEYKRYRAATLGYWYDKVHDYHILT